MGWAAGLLDVTLVEGPYYYLATFFSVFRVVSAIWEDSGSHPENDHHNH